MRILAVSHSSSLGGAENMLFFTVKGLVSRKHDVYCLLSKKGPLASKLEKEGARVIYSKMPWWVRQGESPFIGYSVGFKNRIDEIVKIIATEKIDLVLTNTITIGEAAIAARIAGVPHVWRIAEMLDTDPSLKAPCDLGYFYRMVDFLSTKIVVVSKAVKQEIERFIGTSEKVEVIYDGLEIPSISYDKIHLRRERSNPIILCAAGICKRKGISVFQEAASYLIGRWPKVKFLVAGAIWDQEYYSSLLKTRRKLHLEKSFDFLGFRDDVEELMKRSDIFVLPSLSEPFGVVILEAMRAGVPVVTTLSGGTAEGVVDGVTGYIVLPGDPKALADRIEKMLSNPSEAISMGLKGFERLRDIFSYEGMINSYEKVLQDACVSQVGLNSRISVSLSELVNFLDGLSFGESILREAIYYREMVIKSRPYRCYKRLKNFLIQLTRHLK